MSLDDEVKGLENLQIGNVERAIREIEDSEQKIANISSKTEPEIEGRIKLYKETIQTKLPRIISNIIALGERVCQIEKGYYFSDKDNWGKYYLPTIEIEQKGEFVQSGGFRKKSLWVPKSVSILKIGAMGFKAKFEFNLSDYSLRNISLGGYPPVQNSLDFTNEYLELVENDFRKDGTSSIRYLPHILNLVPEGIAGMYSKKNKEEAERLQKISQGVELRVQEGNDLNISDF
ncbi:MAG: hypothetical protein AABX99_03670 [Nanoarchaeota archaeon]